MHFHPSLMQWLVQARREQLARAGAPGRAPRSLLTLDRFAITAASFRSSALLPRSARLRRGRLSRHDLLGCPGSPTAWPENGLYW
jgi:hypothetical protein